MSQRRYSDEDRANALAALAANGGNVGRTSRQLGIPRATLQAWRNGVVHPEAAENSAPKKAELADKLEGIAHKLLDGLTDDKIATTGARESLVAVGIAVDKMQLLRGKPTIINDNSHHFDDLSEAELDERIRQQQAALNATAGGEATPPSA